MLLQTWRWLSTTRALVGVVIVEAMLASNARRGRMRICQQCCYRRGDGACRRRAVQLSEVVRGRPANRRAEKLCELAQR